MISSRVNLWTCSTVVYPHYLWDVRISTLIQTLWLINQHSIIKEQNLSSSVLWVTRGLAADDWTLHKRNVLWITFHYTLPPDTDSMVYDHDFVPTPPPLDPWNLRILWCRRISCRYHTLKIEFEMTVSEMSTAERLELHSERALASSNTETWSSPALPFSPTSSAFLKPCNYIPKASHQGPFSPDCQGLVSKQEA